jgi:hypothetical protein
VSSRRTALVSINHQGMPTTRCGAAACTKPGTSPWIDTLILTPRGHRQYLVCAEHLEQLADRQPVDLVRPTF